MMYKRAGQVFTQSRFPKGFTLIELLVVVLIIGILAAVALPQYQKAVEKSRAAQALSILKTVYNAAKSYKLANGSWPENFDELAVEIPWTGTTDGVSYGHHRHGKSNPDWSIQILNSSTEGDAITVGRISGPYTGASFYIYDVPHYSQFAQDELVCIERRGTGNGVFHFTKSRGDYCKKIMKGTFVQTQSSGNWDTFKMP